MPRFLFSVLVLLLTAGPAGRVVAQVNTLWVSTYADRTDAGLTADDVLGRSVYLVKQDPSGQVAWYTALGDPLAAEGRYTYDLPDGDRFTAGYARTADGNYTVFLALVGPSGDVRWETTDTVAREYVDPSATDIKNKYLKEWKFSFAVGREVYGLVFTARAIRTDREAAADVPASIALHQNYPNPFNPTTVVPFSLSQTGPVTLKVFDALGREVQTLIDDVRPAGSHAVQFDASGMPSGMYLYRLQAGGTIASKRMLLLR